MSGPGKFLCWIKFNRKLRPLGKKWNEKKRRARAQIAGRDKIKNGERTLKPLAEKPKQKQRANEQTAQSGNKKPPTQKK